jgi:hypothetical protein
VHHKNAADVLKIVAATVKSGGVLPYIKMPATPAQSGGFSSDNAGDAGSRLNPGGTQTDQASLLGDVPKWLQTLLFVGAAGGVVYAISQQKSKPQAAKNEGGREKLKAKIESKFPIKFESNFESNLKTSQFFSDG